MFNAENGREVFERIYDSVTSDASFLACVRDYRPIDFWEDISFHMSRLRVTREEYSDLMAYVYGIDDGRMEAYGSTHYDLFADGFNLVLSFMFYDRYWHEVDNEWTVTD